MGLVAECLETLRALAPGGRRPKMRVQSILFDRDLWTEAKARRWLKREGFRYGKVDATERHLRYRQIDPAYFSTFRTIPFGKETGIQAVVAR